MSKADDGWMITAEPGGPFLPGARARFAYTIRVGTGGIASGGKIYCNFSPSHYGTGDAAGFSLRVQMVELEAPNYLGIESEPGRWEPVGQYAGWYLLKNTGDAIPERSTVAVVSGGPDRRATGTRLSLHPGYETTYHRFLIDPRGDGQWVELSVPRPRILSGEPHYVFARSKTQTKAGDRLPMTVEVCDRFGSPVTGFRGRLRVENGDHEREFELNTKRGEPKVVPVPFREPGVQRPRVQVITEDGKSVLRTTSNPVAVSEEPPKQKVFWGEIHVHSSISTDGVYSPEYCYHYARDIARLDFSAVTDHGEILPFSTDERKYASRPLPWDYDRPVPEELQEEVRRVTREFHEPGEFVTFLGFEWNGEKSGQVNVYYAGDEGELICGQNAALPVRPNTTARLRDAVKGRDTIAIPHHPGYSPAYGMGTMGFDWNQFIPEWMPVVEVYSARHGSSEFKGCPRELGPFDHRRSIQYQLALGHRFGLIAGTDSHIGMAARRINRCPGPHQDGPEKTKYNAGGLAAVFAKELTREAILDALRQRRCYAVSGDRVLLNFELAGHPMGSIIESRDAAELSRCRPFRISIEAASNLQKVELLRNNTVIHSVKPRKSSVQVEFCDETPLGRTMRRSKFSGRQVYYYCRAYLPRGDMAWSSPIWVAGTGRQ